MNQPRTIHEGLVPGENCPDTGDILDDWKRQRERNTRNKSSLRGRVIILRDRYDFTFAEIGKRLGMSRVYASALYHDSETGVAA